MFLFHWIRKETNINNLCFLIKLMVFLRTIFYKTSVNNWINSCSIFFFVCLFYCLFYYKHSSIPQKSTLRKVSENLSSSSVSLWVLLKLSLSICKHMILADLLLLNFSIWNIWVRSFLKLQETRKADFHKFLYVPSKQKEPIRKKCQKSFYLLSLENVPYTFAIML